LSDYGDTVGDDEGSNFTIFDVQITGRLPPSRL